MRPAKPDVRKQGEMPQQAQPQQGMPQRDPTKLAKPQKPQQLPPLNAGIRSQAPSPGGVAGGMGNQQPLGPPLGAGQSGIVPVQQPMGFGMQSPAAMNANGRAPDTSPVGLLQRFNGPQ